VHSSSSTSRPTAETIERSVGADEIGAKLTSWLTRFADRLEVRYRIDNLGSDVLYVMNQIPSRAVDDAVEYRVDDVYVDLAGDTLELTKGALLVRHTFPAVYQYPDARVVAAGESLTETLVLSLPVKVRIPYRRKSGRGEVRASRKAVARRIALSIGVVPADSGCTFSRDRPAHPDVVTVRGESFEPGGGLLLIGQTMLSTRFPLSEDLPVLDYESIPWDSH